MKNSIKVFIAIIAISVQCIKLYAQSTNNSTGIYLTEKDYKAGKLSYVLSNNDKLQLNCFLGENHIGVVYQGKKMKLSKSEIFGYRQNNQDFRFYQNHTYRILDTTGFMLYSRQQLIPQGKGYMSVSCYFYSINSADQVLSLTIENIDKSFAAQSDFRYTVQNYFHQDADLIAYDKADNQYQIKYLYFEHKRAATTQHAAL